MAFPKHAGAAHSPLFYGPLVETYTKIMETQRQLPRALIHVPDVNYFLHTNFFLSIDNLSSSSSPLGASPSMGPSTTLKPTGNSTLIQTPKLESQPASIMNLARDLVAMGSSTDSGTSQIPSSISVNIRSPKQTTIRKSVENLPQLTKIIAKASNEEKKRFLATKKLPIPSRFSKIGIIPVLSLNDIPICALQQFIKEIIKEQKISLLYEDKKTAVPHFDVQEEEKIEETEQEKKEEEQEQERAKEKEKEKNIKEIQMEETEIIMSGEVVKSDTLAAMVAEDGHEIRKDSLVQVDSQEDVEMEESITQDKVEIRQNQEVQRFLREVEDIGARKNVE